MNITKKMNPESEKLPNGTDTTQICRLCSSKQNLSDLFSASKEKCNFYQTLLFCATGIEIKKDDVVSKMVCRSCCEIAIKLHKYRTNAITNDKLLKEKYSTNGNNDVLPKPDLSSTLRAIHLFNSTISKELSNQSEAFIRITASNSDSGVSKRSTINYHPSVKNLLQSNPNLIISKELFRQDISPVVTLDESEVTDWYADQLSQVKKKLGNIIIKKLDVNVDEGNDENKKESTYYIESPKNSFQIKCSTGNSSVKVLSPSEIKNIIYGTPEQLREDAKNINYQHFLKNLSPKTQDKITPSLVADHKLTDAQNSTTPSHDVEKVSLTSGTNNLNINSTGLSSKPIRQKRSTSEEFPKLFEYLKNKTNPNKKVCKRSKVKNKPQTSKQHNVGNNKKSHTKQSSLDSFVGNAAMEPKEMKEDNDKNALGVSESNSLFIINKEKSLEVFVCLTCSLVCESKNKLESHQKTHLSCSICKKRFKNISCLEKHIEEKCVITRVNDNAKVKLVRVDSIPSMVERYFQKSSDSKSDEKNDESNSATFHYYDRVVKCEDDVEVDVTMDNEENICATNEIDNVENICATNEIGITGNVENMTAKNVVEDSSSIVCISDNSDNEVECSGFSTDPNLKVAYLDLTKSEQDVMNKSFYTISKMYINESDMIETLYRKHYLFNKVQNATQTFKPSNKNIKYSPGNIIVLRHMYPELLFYRIPVHFKCNTKICVEFGTPEIPSSNDRPLEYWGHKESIDIKPFVPTVTSNVISSQNIISAETNDFPFKIIDVSTETDVPIAHSDDEPLPVINSFPIPTKNSELLTSTSVPTSSCLAQLLLTTTPTSSFSNIPSPSGTASPMINTVGSPQLIALLDKNMTQLNNLILVSNQLQNPLLNDMLSNKSNEDVSKKADTNVDEIIEIN